MSYFIHCKIPRNLIAEANKLAPKGAINNRSITNGERNVVGVLGELCYIKLIECICVDSFIDYTPTYDYDMLLGTLKFDVKTKQRTVAPRGDYAASIAAYSKNKQHCDYYAFTSITIDRATNEYTDFYYLGHIRKNNYFKRATFKKKGELDGNNIVNKNGNFKPFTITEDCYNIEYNKLTQYPIDILDGLSDDFNLFHY